MSGYEQLVKQAFVIANAAVICDIESYCTQVHIGGWLFWDTTHWTSLHEHAAEEVDMAKQAIDYALQAGLAMQHPQQKHLLRLLRGPR